MDHPRILIIAPSLELFLRTCEEKRLDKGSAIFVRKLVDLRGWHPDSRVIVAYSGGMHWMAESWRMDGRLHRADQRLKLLLGAAKQRRYRIERWP